LGAEKIEAEPPDWKTVRSTATELLGRTKDLRVTMLLLRSVVATDGLAGLDGGLAVLRGLVERYWADFHPRLDPDDWNDPTMRMNILSALCSPTSVLREIREAKLVESRTLGRFSLKDVEVATGQAAPPAGGEAPDSAAVDGAFLECELAGLQATAASVERSLQHVAAIDAAVTEQVSASQAPDLSALPKVLEAARNVLGQKLARRGVAGVAGAAPAGGPGPAGAPQPIAGEVNSREDVIRVLDKACDYFARTEPSSPVPLLLKRAKRLVSKDFMDIMRDIAPDGLQQASTVTGVSKDE
jgi:type VI secretion system protein ImpA